MKNLLFLLPFAIMGLPRSQAQTNVTGGIFSNTVWTQSGSPYIVTGNVVVFPGNILTIEPGVTVKFNDGFSLELRQSSLISKGTALNPIVFTTNNPNAAEANWDMVLGNASLTLEIDHCAFHFATYGLRISADTVRVTNSLFTNNTWGMHLFTYKYAKIDNCTFRNNKNGQVLSSTAVHGRISNCRYTNNLLGLLNGGGSNIVNCVIDSNSATGLLMDYLCNDTVRGNEIKYNGDGLEFKDGCQYGHSVISNNVIEYNNVGVVGQYVNNNMIFELRNNVICANTSYNFKSQTQAPLSVPYNCWCKTTVASIDSTIFDAHDDVNYGIVTYTPVNTVNCFADVGVTEQKTQNSLSYRVVPNPIGTSGILQFFNWSNETCVFLLYDASGRIVRRINHVAGPEISVERGELNCGIYFFSLQSKSGELTSGKLMVE